MSPRLNYVELPVRDTARSKLFFERAFGWSLAAFGPDYAATLDAGAGGTADIGLNGDSGEATAAPIAVIEVGDLEAALTSVKSAGGIIIRPIFAFPGGRRFHFREPSGNELAVYVNEPG